MRFLLVLALLLPATPSIAKDVALILNEQRQQALQQVLDAAVRGQGLQIAPTVVDLLNVLRTAPTVTEQPPRQPESPKE